MDSLDVTGARLLDAVSGATWASAWQLVLGALGSGIVAWWLDRRRAGRGGARRQRALAWTRCHRRLRVAVPLALVAAAAAAALRWLAGLRGVPAVQPFLLFAPGVYLALAAPATVGCYLVLDAGRLEARGRLKRARDQARVGGKLAFLAALVLLVAVGGALFRLPAPTRAALLGPGVAAAFALLVGALAVGLAGFVALLAGLAGKPRPSGTAAALLYLGGVSLWFAAAESARALARIAGC